MSDPALARFLQGKSELTVSLFEHFVREYKRIGKISFIPAKTMIGVVTSRKRIAYVTRLGKDFVHVVFMFDRAYQDNLCFEKIAQVPGQNQFNHHFRMKAKEDLNVEVIRFMRLAYKTGL